MGGKGTVVKKDQTLCLTQSVMEMRNFVLMFYSEDKMRMETRNDEDGNEADVTIGLDVTSRKKSSKTRVPIG